MNGFFVTGTDTGVGKTRVACALLHALRSLGFEAVGMKPVASGCARTASGWRNEDALMLQQCSEPTPLYDLVNPYALPEATAPEIAARLANVTIRFEVIENAFSELRHAADLTVVEGVGGWLAPISRDLDQHLIPARLDLQPILVIGLRLGCLHQARATLMTMEKMDMAPIGWVCSRVDPELAHSDDYFIALMQAMKSVPCLGDLPYMPDGDAIEASKHLDSAVLLQSLVAV